MVKVIRQLCIKSYKVESFDGDFWQAEQGKIYTTSVPFEEDEFVIVFSNFWVAVPKEHFVICEGK